MDQTKPLDRREIQSQLADRYPGAVLEWPGGKPLLYIPRDLTPQQQAELTQLCRSLLDRLAE